MPEPSCPGLASAAGRKASQRAADKVDLGGDPGGSPLSFTRNSLRSPMNTALNDAFYAVHAVELRPRRAPHEAALTIRDPISTACEAALSCVDPRRLVIRAVQQRQQRQQHDHFMPHVHDSDHVQICTTWLAHAFRCFIKSPSRSQMDCERLSTRSVDEHLVWMGSSSERDGTAASHTSSSL